MDNFTVDGPKFAGLELELQDFGVTFSSNANQLLPTMSLSTRTTGQLAALTPPVRRLQATLSSAHYRANLRRLALRAAPNRPFIEPERIQAARQSERGPERQPVRIRRQRLAGTRHRFRRLTRLLSVTTNE
uniref:hypothetical protein n=1 Tax=Nocardia donostiensis TaxID=1538463 RepID=UPI00111C4E9F|nr:hypothetical protein [Nocardia donostiensis]